MNHLIDTDQAADLYVTLRKEENLMQVLVDMQTEQGLLPRAAMQNAERLLQLMADRQVLTDSLSEDASAVLDKFLAWSHRLSDGERQQMLHEMRFGLELFQNPELSAQITDMDSVQLLFRQYYDRCGSDPALTVEALEDRIRQLVGGFHLSPQALEALAFWLKGTDVLATCAVLSEDGKRFRCVAAMDLYLRNKDTMTMEEAVNAACTGVDIQAAADAVSCGQLTERRAAFILSIVTLAVLILSLYWCFDYRMLTQKIADGEFMNPMPTGGSAESVRAFLLEEEERMATLADKRFWAFTIGTLLSSGLLLSESAVTKWCGRLATKQRFVRSQQELQTVQTLNTMASRQETGAQAPAAEPVRPAQSPRQQAAVAKDRRIRVHG